MFHCLTWYSRLALATSERVQLRQREGDAGVPVQAPDHDQQQKSQAICERVPQVSDYFIG